MEVCPQNSTTTTITFGIEENNKLTLLDLLFKKTQNTFESSVNRKKIHTETKFDSKHPIFVKTEFVKSLYERAKINCSNSANKHKSISYQTIIDYFSLYLTGKEFQKIE